MTESREPLRACSFAGNSHFDTLENDFFFRRGGCALRTSGRGGGGGSARSRRVGVRGLLEDTEDEDEDVAVNAADASVNDLSRLVLVQNHLSQHGE